MNADAKQKAALKRTRKAAKRVSLHAPVKPTNHPGSEQRQRAQRFIKVGCSKELAYSQFGSLA